LLFVDGPRKPLVLLIVKVALLGLEVELRLEVLILAPRLFAASSQGFSWRTTASGYLFFYEFTGCYLKHT